MGMALLRSLLLIPALLAPAAAQAVPSWQAVTDSCQPQTESLPKTPGTSAWVPVVSSGEAASAKKPKNQEQ
jgi:hypothetical protein